MRRHETSRNLKGDVDYSKPSPSPNTSFIPTPSSRFPNYCFVFTTPDGGMSTDKTKFLLLWMWFVFMQLIYKIEN